MKIITAKTGEQILVDDEDFASLSQYTWHLNDGYACRVTTIGGKNGKRVRLRMHRLVLGLDFKSGEIVDHINRNKLDNQKSNLRVCPKSENEWNRQKYSTNETGFQGVSVGKNKTNPFVAQIKVHSKKIWLGEFPTAEDAHDAYITAKQKYHA